MKSGWVITQEGTQHATEVVGLLSARKSAKSVKEYVEWLYALLNYEAEGHFALARYNSPYIPYKAQYWTTNTGVPVQSLMHCGHNPFLTACLAKNISLNSGDNIATYLQWTLPDRIECDPKTLMIKQKIPGRVCQAPVSLPFVSRSTVTLTT